MRKLRADEAALWARVVESVEPLSRKSPPRSEPTVEAPAPTPRQQAKARAAVKPPRPVVTPPPARAHAEKTLDGGWDRRLRQGKVAPDRIIDLHGQRLDGAWEAIDRGIERAIASGDRLVLLVTGHAPKGEPPVARGKIRAAVHDWLGASRHADAIAAVRGAAPRHGGRGALYLVLRRSR